MHKRAVSIAQARIGIVSNNEKLITESRYFEGQVLESLLTNIHSIQPIPYTNDLDAYFVAIDDPNIPPLVKVTEKVLFATGDFSRYERECSDNRYSLFGNLGLFFKYLLVTLERYHQVYSFHASSMFSPSRNTLLLVVGGPGAGKTVFLLKGLEDDWQIFSTEMTHFRFTEQGYVFYMGSLFDNIRLGTLIYDFPEANKRLKVEIPEVPDIWGHKIAIDMRHIAGQPHYVNPRVAIVDAKIESGRDIPIVKTITRKEKIVKLLFDNATEKPRAEGITMVIDKGLGLNATEDLLDAAGDVIDFIKLTFGTSAFIDLDYLAEKTEMVKDAGIYICPGGTFLEVSVWQGTYTKYLKRCKELGFNAIEVSDGTIEIDMKTRADCIKRAVDMGFKVVSEVGKKDPSEAIAAKIMHEEIAADLANGAFKVIVEAREAGKGVGIYDKDGKPKLDEVEAIIKGVDDITKLEWEAPIKNQQEFLILRFGVNVSLGNVPPDDILALEALRNGLRGDTLKRAFMANPKYHKK